MGKKDKADLSLQKLRFRPGGLTVSERPAINHWLLPPRLAKINDIDSISFLFSFLPIISSRLLGNSGGKIHQIHVINIHFLFPSCFNWHLVEGNECREEMKSCCFAR